MNIEKTVLGLCGAILMNMSFAQETIVDYAKIKEIAPAVQIYFDLSSSDIKKKEPLS